MLLQRAFRDELDEFPDLIRGLNPHRLILNKRFDARGTFCDA